jgi:preprotein translocase YajC subunit
MQFVTLITMLCLVLFLNFAIIRPHRQKQKRFESTMASVREGSVIYASGIRGVVTEVRRDSILLVTGPRRTLLEIDKNSVESVDSASNISKNIHKKRDEPEKLIKGRQGANPLAGCARMFVGSTEGGAPKF